ncbi:MAG TPA: putative ABC transporter permease [Microlunatus sp.]|nr:putative ABC transporter permease [Microlunatus sp.]
MLSDDTARGFYFALWAFLIYSFLGVVVEMVFCYAKQYRGVIESRCGLLYLPLSPIYGFGGVAVSVFLLPHVDDPVGLFFLAMAVCTVLEYVASFVMEKLFGTVFWDYSDRPLNLQGRICLQYTIYWGILGLLLVYVLDPAVADLIQAMPLPGAAYLLAVLIVLTLLSVVLTLLAFRRFDQKVAYLKAQRDGRPLPPIDTRVGRLVDRLVPDVVMINTFPRMSHLVDYMELTGERRKLIVADLHLGTPTERHLRHNEALARARATEGIAAG